MFGWNGSRNSRRISWSVRRRRAPAAPRAVSARLGDLLDEARRSRTAAASVCFETATVGVLLVAAAAAARSSACASSPPSDDAAPDREHERGRQHPREVLVVVVLEDREERVALEQVVLAPGAVARSSTRGAGGTTSDVGHVPHPVAEQPEPPAEVDVLEEHEVALVEPADPLEHARSASTIAAPGREQHVGAPCRASTSSGAPTCSLKPVPVERQRGVDEVDGLALPVEHLAGHARDRGVGVAARRPRRASQPRVGPGVVVEERDVLAGRLARRRGCSRRRSRGSRRARGPRRPGSAR